jgi:hypothetical protein
MRRFVLVFGYVRGGMACGIIEGKKTILRIGGEYEV